MYRNICLTSLACAPSAGGQSSIRSNALGGLPLRLCFMQGHQYTRHTKRAILLFAVTGLMCIIFTSVSFQPKHIRGHVLANSKKAQAVVIAESFKKRVGLVGVFRPWIPVIGANYDHWQNQVHAPDAINNTWHDYGLRSTIPNVRFFGEHHEFDGKFFLVGLSAKSPLLSSNYIGIASGVAMRCRPLVFPEGKEQLKINKQFSYGVSDILGRDFQLHVCGFCRRWKRLMPKPTEAESANVRVCP